MDYAHLVGVYTHIKYMRTSSGTIITKGHPSYEAMLLENNPHNSIQYTPIREATHPMRLALLFPKGCLIRPCTEGGCNIQDGILTR